MGFSAGGHLASTVGTHYHKGTPDAADPIDRMSCRPDFMILVYPVISLIEPYTHGGSRDNLLGKDADRKLVEELSNERQVTADTPQTFLLTTDQDGAVPAENSIYFALALRKAHVPVEWHMFEVGGHGFGLGGNRVSDGTSKWTDQLADWLKRGNCSTNLKAKTDRRRPNETRKMSNGRAFRETALVFRRSSNGAQILQRFRDKMHVNVAGDHDFHFDRIVGSSCIAASSAEMMQ